jgi:hypothetical protein
MKLAINHSLRFEIYLKWLLHYVKARLSKDY